MKGREEVNVGAMRALGQERQEERVGEKKVYIKGNTDHFDVQYEVTLKSKKKKKGISSVQSNN